MSSSLAAVFINISEIHIVINRAYSSIFEVGFLGLFKTPDYAKAILEIESAREEIISLHESGDYSLKTTKWLIAADGYCHLSTRMIKKLVGKVMGIKYNMSEYKRDLDLLHIVRLSELDAYEPLLSEFTDLFNKNALSGPGGASKPSLTKNASLPNSGSRSITSKNTPQRGSDYFNDAVHSHSKIDTPKINIPFESNSSGSPDLNGVKKTPPAKQAPTHTHTHTHTQGNKIKCYLCYHEYDGHDKVSRCKSCGYLNRGNATQSEITSFLLSERQGK